MPYDILTPPDEPTDEQLEAKDQAADTELHYRRDLEAMEEDAEAGK